MHHARRRSAKSATSTTSRPGAITKDFVASRTSLRPDGGRAAQSHRDLFPERVERRRTIERGPSPRPPPRGRIIVNCQYFCGIGGRRRAAVEGSASPMSVGIQSQQ
jgi:hypothetical protein